MVKDSTRMHFPVQTSRFEFLRHVLARTAHSAPSEKLVGEVDSRFGETFTSCSVAEDFWHAHILTQQLSVFVGRFIPFFVQRMCRTWIPLASSFAIRVVLCLMLSL